MKRCRATTQVNERCMHPAVRAFGDLCLTHFRMEQLGKKVRKYKDEMEEPVQEERVD